MQAVLHAWHRDESLYSWAAVHHVMVGCASPTVTGIELFGRRHAYRLHDATSGLDHFVRVTDGRLGSVKELMMNRSVLGIHWAVWDSARRHRVLASLVEGNSAYLGLASGLTASRINCDRALRYCEVCARDDRQNTGLARWRLPHQWPGCTVCISHMRPLIREQRTAARWLLPELPSRHSSKSNMSDTSLEMDARIGRVANVLASVNGGDLGALRKACIVRLTERCDGVSLKRLKSDSIGKWFRTTSTAHSAGTPISLASGDWILKLCRERRTDHPLKWILLWSSLCEVDSIDRCCDQLQSILSSSSPLDVQQSELWPELTQETSILPAHIELALLQSDTLKDAAARLHVTVAILKRWLSGSPGAEDKWRSNLRERRIAACRDRILDTARSDLTVTRSKVLSEMKTECAWLSDNAPAELRNVLNQIPSSRMQQRQIV